MSLWALDDKKKKAEIKPLQKTAGAGGINSRNTELMQYKTPFWAKRSAIYLHDQ